MIKLELSIGCPIDSIGSAFVGSLDRTQIRVKFRSAAYASLKALSRSLVFTYAGHWLHKGLFAVLAVESSLLNDEIENFRPEGLIFDFDRSVIIDSIRKCCAFGTDFEV